jgi:multidrug transporter EmrE-like cation transporter
LALTDRRTQSIALPIACATVLVLDVSAAALSKALAPLGVSVEFAAFSSISLVLLAVTIQQILARQHAIVQPALARR